MIRYTFAIIPLILLFQPSTAQKAAGDRKVGGGCESCDEMYEGMPKELASMSVIANRDEPGEPMIISGTIFKPDGKTPARDIILYVYHTDNTGNYSRAQGQKVALRHGRLRGWIKTDATGRYQFTTIRPAAYPGRTDPAHIHPLVKEPGLSLYWIDEYLFDDDPLLTATFRANQEKHGGSGIIKLTKNAQGAWTGHRDIILGLNIPGY